MTMASSEPVKILSMQLESYLFHTRRINGDSSGASFEIVKCSSAQVK